jgi:uncharacterized membrane protein
MTIHIFDIFLAVHITGGSTGLIAGTINMIRKKGDHIHRMAGRFFFYGMLTAAAAALVMSAIHTNYFLFITGVFTIYMVTTGRRYLSLRGDQKPKPIDWASAAFMLFFAVLFIGSGIYKLANGQTFGFVFLVFGAIGMSMVRADIKNYTGKTDLKNTWLVLHLQRMIGTYIAAITAFLVVNLPHSIMPSYLSFIPWLLPTFIITPLIFKWTKKYQVKKKPI